VTMTSADIPDRAEPPARSALSGPRAQAPKRRTFSTAYKQRIVRQYDSLTDPVERGVLLRREGLYHSHLEYWRATLPTDKGGNAPFGLGSLQRRSRQSPGYKPTGPGGRPKALLIGGAATGP